MNRGMGLAVILLPRRGVEFPPRYLIVINKLSLSLTETGSNATGF